MSARDRIAERFEAWTGITPSCAGTSSSLDRFVDDRVRELGLASPHDYLARLPDLSAPEAERMIDAVTVPHTWFFRDPEQLDAASELFRRAPAGRPARVWVPGCATGEDAFTIAMLALRAGKDVEVLGTDISARTLSRAQRGVYDAWSVRDVPPDLRAALVPRPDGAFAVGDAARRGVAFARHNVLDPAPAPSSGSSWDLIVFRNVLIYFAASKIGPIVSRLAGSLAPGGFLMLGASDVLFQLPPGLRTAPGLRVLERVAIDALPAPIAPITPPVIAAPPRAPASDRAPFDLIELVSRGNARLDAGDLGGAIAIYDEAAAIDPACAEVHLFAGIAHHSAGDPDAALDALRRCLLLGPSLWPAAFYLALSYERLGRPEEALRAYERVASAGAASFELRSRSAFATDLQRWKGDIVAAAKRRSSRPLGAT